MITPTGLEPPDLRLSPERAVLFWNATGSRLVVVAVESADPALCAPDLARGFRLRGSATVCEPLAPGDMAALAVPPGATLRYAVPGGGGAPTRHGRIRRAER